MSDILIVEDEREIQQLLSVCLEREGFSHNISSSGEEAVRYVKEKGRPSLILLDIMLPGMDGFTACEQIRQYTKAPIIFLSCKNEDRDKVLGLSLGADDYMEKPFSLNVLLARIKAHLRRNRILEQVEAPPKQNLITFDHITINLDAHEVYKNGEPLHFTHKEYELLVLMAENPNSVFSADKLLDSIWGIDTKSELRTVVVHISSLRKKIEENPLEPKYIVTVRGAGYKFVPPK